MVLISHSAGESLSCGRDRVTGVVIWRPREQDPALVRSRLRDAWVSIADIARESWVRSEAANPLADANDVLTAVDHALGAR